MPISKLCAIFTDDTMTLDTDIYIKSPSDCSDDELSTFHALVLKGRKVQENGLYSRIKNCKYLGFCKFKGTVVAVSAIKTPSENYKKSVIDKADIDRKPSDIDYEIGYSFTEEKYRRRGISKRIKKMLLDKINGDESLIFSTTAIDSSKNFFLANGFTVRGKSYDGDNDKNIQYFERHNNKSINKT